MGEAERGEAAPRKQICPLLPMDMRAVSLRSRRRSPYRVGLSALRAAGRHRSGESAGCSQG